MPTLMPILFLKCVVGTVRVKSVYTCTAQTVQFSRGQGSHHRLYTVQLQESSHKIWDRQKERKKERQRHAPQIRVGRFEVIF